MNTGKEIKGLVNALEKIEQMSDCGSYEASIIEMKSIATDVLKKFKEGNVDAGAETFLPSRLDIENKLSKILKNSVQTDEHNSAYKDGFLMGATYVVSQTSINQNNLVEGDAEKEIPFRNIFGIIHEWLNSDDVFVRAKDEGEILPDAYIDCVKGSLLKRLTKALPKGKVLQETKFNGEGFKKVEDWWNSLKPEYRTIDIIYRHFETYFQSQNKSEKEQSKIEKAIEALTDLYNICNDLFGGKNAPDSGEIPELKKAKKVLLSLSNK